MIDAKTMFTYQPPKPDQIPRYEALRAKALEFALLIEEHCPGSPDRTIAIRHVQQAVMYANASIALYEPGEPE